MLVRVQALVLFNQGRVMMPAGPRSTRVEVLCQERLHLTSFLNLPSACYRNIMVLDEFRDQLCSLVLYLRPLEADTSCVTLRLLAYLECKPHPALRCAALVVRSSACATYSCRIHHHQPIPC